ncbi:MAG: hypothetical protein RLZZ440_2379 [Planctomycetota bacterium]|jgi:hypothetical protein
MSRESEAKTRVIHRQATAKGTEPAAGAGQLVFHCPNGHRIVVAASLAGKRGKCSKCGVAVQIPGLEARGPETTAEPPGAAGTAEPASALAETGEFAAGGGPINHQAAPEAIAPESWDFVGDQPSASDWPAGGGDESVDPGHPTASLVARLWVERQHGGVIELHLANGSVILPEWYDANWSRGSHGLFASQAADGTVTLTAVAWETVQKVIVRKLTAVPDDMFR